MALQSMTGFARVEGQNEAADWVWEVRSVNGKGLDFRLRTPPGYDRLQPQIRKLVSRYFSRGNLQIHLSVDRAGSVGLPVINQPALNAVLEAVEELRNKLGGPPPVAEQILKIRGVLETGENTESDEERTQLDALLMADFDKLMQQLEKARSEEGSAIAGFMNDQLDRIENLTLAVTNDPSRTLEQIKSRLNDQVSRLLDNTSGLDLDRLHQEAAILAAKADLQEELDRLNAHIAAAHELLGSEGPLGRKLEFLIQEFNRECNTICSKSNAPAVTANGLDMKVVIDQLREQVQNLE
ncbi:MAG: YicC family protein [Rhizobiaceae bacterium]|nr:YicC family protein [Rhizobiaceae bacterium]